MGPCQNQRIRSLCTCCRFMFFSRVIDTNECHFQLPTTLEELPPRPLRLASFITEHCNPTRLHKARLKNVLRRVKLDLFKLDLRDGFVDLHGRGQGLAECVDGSSLRTPSKMDTNVRHVGARAFRPSSPNSLERRSTFVTVLLTRIASARACRVGTRQRQTHEVYCQTPSSLGKLCPTPAPSAREAAVCPAGAFTCSSQKF